MTESTFRNACTDALAADDLAAYDTALAEYTAAYARAAERWVACGVYKKLAGLPAVGPAVTERFAPGAGGPVAFRVRAALAEVLWAAEHFRGVIFEATADKAAELASLGVTRPHEAPADFAERVAAQVVRIADFDDEDQAEFRQKTGTLFFPIRASPFE